MTLPNVTFKLRYQYRGHPLLVHLVKLSLEHVVKHSPMGGELKLTTRTGLFFLVVSSINYLNLFALEKEDKKWHPVKTNI